MRIDQFRTTLAAFLHGFDADGAHDACDREAFEQFLDGYAFKRDNGRLAGVFSDEIIAHFTVFGNGLNYPDDDADRAANWVGHHFFDGENPYFPASGTTTEQRANKSLLSHVSDEGRQTFDTIRRISGHYLDLIALCSSIFVGEHELMPDYEKYTYDVDNRGLTLENIGACVGAIRRTDLSPRMEQRVADVIVFSALNALLVPSTVRDRHDQIVRSGAFMGTFLSGLHPDVALRAFQKNMTAFRSFAQALTEDGATLTWNDVCQANGRLLPGTRNLLNEGFAASSQNSELSQKIAGVLDGMSVERSKEIRQRVGIPTLSALADAYDERQRLYRVARTEQQPLAERVREEVSVPQPAGARHP